MDNQFSISNFIGNGITFPFQLVNGTLPLYSGFELIRSSLITILSWPLGKRFFLAEFGSNLYNLLEEPNDDILKDLIRIFVIDAIAKWEPRIELVDLSLQRTTDISIDLTLTYKILAIKKEDTFTFPFYKKIIY
jgi:phage baseplate assembly protein W